jgi:uncharacterized PurR-regulated membrane protein YhhQ (DUF165 family)
MGSGDRRGTGVGSHADRFRAEPHRVRRLFVALVAMGVAFAPALAFADNLGAIGKGMGVLLLGGLAILVVLMVPFIVLAVLLTRRNRSPRQGRRLVLVTWVMAIVWYAASLVPIAFALTSGGSDAGVLVLAFCGGALPAHISSIVALVRARNLARQIRSLAAGGSS